MPLRFSSPNQMSWEQARDEAIRRFKKMLDGYNWSEYEARVRNMTIEGDQAVLNIRIVRRSAFNAVQLAIEANFGSSNEPAPVAQYTVTIDRRGHIEGMTPH